MRHFFWKATKSVSIASVRQALVLDSYRQALSPSSVTSARVATIAKAPELRTQKAECPAV
jgi:hypothetical protein